MKNITIVIPSYNEVQFIERAILSAVSQAEFVIVSDNCSTDGTQEICKKLTKEFSNLIFYAQEKNIGAVKNAEFLYKQVQTDYVMTMGAHDALSENYVYELKKCLDKKPEAIMAFAPSICIDNNDNILEEKMLDDFDKGFSSENILERVYTAIVMEYNYAFFGLFRTKGFLSNALFDSKAGVDHVIMSKCAASGKFLRCLNTRFYLRVPTREESNEAYMERLSGINQQVDMSYMCANQLSILDSIYQINMIEKDIYYNNAKIYLNNKYNFFCNEYVRFIINKIKLSKQNIILYGAGTNTKEIIEILKANILFIVDKDVEKHNTYFHGLPIYSIDKIHKYEDINILISPRGRFDIISQDLMEIYHIPQNRLISLEINKDFMYEFIKINIDNI